MLPQADGDVVGACDAMLDVYVETYGSLSKREKVDFILEQIRLTIAKQVGGEHVFWFSMMLVADGGWQR